MEFSSHEWSNLTKTALKVWHRPFDLAKHPLIDLAIVRQHRVEMGYPADMNGQAQALRDLLDKAILLTAPPNSEPPPTEDAPEWGDPTWRTWCLLTLLYKRRKSRGLTQLQIGMAEGGQYYRELRRAITELAGVLQDWEAEANQPAQMLIWPGGAVKLNDPFYIDRECDGVLNHILQTSGRTITIRGARQVGKTSLLIRGIEMAVKNAGSQPVYFDLQAMSQTDLSHYDTFLRLIAEWSLDELDLEIELAEKMWESRVGSARKLTKLIEREILPAIKTPLVLAFDEVDRLMTTPFSDDFFGLLRSWHNLRSRNPLWEQLTVLMSISTEPYLLIQDLQQSPFNVGQTIYLKDFDLKQVETLNQRHGMSISLKEVEDLWHWTGGHPYLTRLAFYTLIENQLALPNLRSTATDSDSLFADHLSHLWHLLSKEEALLTGMQEVLNGKIIKNESAKFRLLKAGLIHRINGRYVCRCQLYRHYLEKQL